MMRIDWVKNAQNHAWYKKQIAKLSDKEKEIIFSFIAEHDFMNKNDFEKSLNRFFLDREKPKRFSIILELLSAANSACQ